MELHKCVPIYMEGIYLHTQKYSSCKISKCLSALSFVFPGNMSLILTAPHGGLESPSDIPDRDYGCYRNGNCVWSHDCGTKDRTRWVKIGYYCYTMGLRMERGRSKWVIIIITLLGQGWDRVGRNWLLLLHYGAENLTGWVKIVNYHYIMGPRQNREVLNRLSF